MAREYTYRNLVVWERAQRLAVEIISITARLPTTWANGVIARQIIASATSIGANIAEGHGRFSPAAHRNHLSIAKGSVAETDSWLDLLLRLNLINRDEEARLHQECNEITAMLMHKIHALEDLAQQQRSQTREQTELYDVQSVFVESDYFEEPRIQNLDQ